MRADCDPAAMMQWSKETVLTPSLVSTASRCGEANWPRPSTTVTLRALARRAEAAGQLVHHAVLELAQAVEIDLGLAERQPEVCSLLGVGDHLRGVEQAPWTECSRRSGRRRRCAGSARPAPPSCRGRRPETPRCSRRVRSRAPAPRRGRSRRGAARRPSPAPRPGRAPAGVPAAGRLLRDAADAGASSFFSAFGSGFVARLRRGAAPRRLRGVEQQDDRALRDPIPDLHLQLFDRPRLRRGNLDGRLVGLERHERRVLGDDVARLHDGPR